MCFMLTFSTLYFPSNSLSLELLPHQGIAAWQEVQREIWTFAMGFSCCLQMEQMEGRWLQLNFMATSPTEIFWAGLKSASLHCFIPSGSLALHINRKKKVQLPYPNQSCPVRWSCQQQRKFMLVLIMALKSSLMKNYLWVCLFWACFTHSTWVTGAKFHLITDVLFQNVEYSWLEEKKRGALQTQVHMEHFFWQGP